MKVKKLGLFSAVSTGIGLIVATSCLMSLGQGSGVVGVGFILPMIIVCLLNMMTAASLCELNAILPNLTGGLAQYTLTCIGPLPAIVSVIGGYLVCNSLTASTEGAMFGIAFVSITGLPISPIIVSLIITMSLTLTNLLGVNIFAKIQGTVALALVASFVILGGIGAFAAGTGALVSQPFFVSKELGTIMKMAPVAFWLFIGVEFIIPLGKDMKNPQRDVPRGMFISLLVVCVIQILMIFGFHNYTMWGDLKASDSPHLLYGMNVLGNFGKGWMGIVAILAAVSTQNSVINGLSKICLGMSKMNLLPEVFQKTNKRGAPIYGVLLIGSIISFVQGSGISTADDIMFLILTGSMFWMISYIISHINVLVLRKRYPKAIRSFKIPFGPTFPIIDIGGIIYMVVHIDPNPAVRNKIWLYTIMVLVLLIIYGVIWIKVKMKRPIWKHMDINEVMALENDRYYNNNEKIT